MLLRPSAVHGNFEKVTGMTPSLKTTSYAAVIFMALILGFLLLLGSRQYKSHKEYTAIIEQNEKIIFQFATIREHITESLLENRPQQLNAIINEIENLNVNISQVLQQPIIPDEYRLSFAGQVDFAGIILLLRNIGAGDQPQAKIRQLNQEIRILGERLLLFDRVIVEHVKRKLVGFQNVVIGLLAVILFIVTNILLFWHGRIGTPLLELAKQAREVTAGKRSNLSLRKKRGDVAELAKSFQGLLAKQKEASRELSRYSRILEMVHNVSETVRLAQTRDAVFADACRGILTNSEYVLVWIGIPGEDNRIVPVLADGSTTMSRQERDECMTALLTAAEENRDKYDVAHAAIKQQTPVIKRAILDGLPKGHFKNTPFAATTPDCIALPLIFEQRVYGVVTIFSIAPPGFTEEEVELLKSMTREIVFTLYSLAEKESDRTMAFLQAARKKLFESTSDIVMVIKTDGTVLEANPSALRKVTRKNKTIDGATFYDVFNSTGQTADDFLKSLKDNGKKISLELGSSDGDYTVHISPLDNQGEAETFLVVARDISQLKTQETEVVKASKLAAMGELAMGVANEINNLTNGLINFTQILSDEIEVSAGDSKQPEELLNKIMQEGERISKIIQQLLFFNVKHPRTREAIKISKIVEDSLALTKHQFSYDAIKVDLNFPENLPSVQGDVQEMQHIFLNLLSNARYALNQRYPGKSPRKCIEIKGELTERNNQALIKIVCTDFGTGIPPGTIGKVFDPFFSTKPDGIGTGLGLSICRRIVEDNNGTMEIKSIPDDHTSAIIELPAVT